MMRKALVAMMTYTLSQALLTHQVRPHPQIRRSKVRKVMTQQGRDHPGHNSLAALEVLLPLPA